MDTDTLELEGYRIHDTGWLSKFMMGCGRVGGTWEWRENDLYIMINFFFKSKENLDFFFNFCPNFTACFAALHSLRDISSPTRA